MTGEMKFSLRKGMTEFTFFVTRLRECWGAGKSLAKEIFKEKRLMRLGLSNRADDILSDSENLRVQRVLVRPLNFILLCKRPARLAR